MALHEQYILRVTAGAIYDPAAQKDVLVNTEKPLHVSSDLIDAKIFVRIKDYRGLPKSCPSTSPYFATPQHPYDRYSIAFSFRLKEDVPGDKLVFGNDFDHPIRDRLPPLFDKAFGIVKWWIDPGLDGDVYCDEPYLYGAVLSSINVLRIGELGSGVAGDTEDTKKSKDAESTEETKVEGAEQANSETERNTEAVVYEEGGQDEGAEIREKLGIPERSAARQKHFLNEAKRKEFVFEKGREYSCDFFNPYLDFNEFALKIGYGLPNISIIGHWDGQPLRTHSLRYVLKNRETNKELFVVLISLVPTADAKKAGVEDAEEKLKEVHGGETKDEDDDLD